MKSGWHTLLSDRKLSRRTLEKGGFRKIPRRGSLRGNPSPPVSLLGVRNPEGPCGSCTHTPPGTPLLGLWEHFSPFWTPMPRVTPTFPWPSRQQQQYHAHARVVLSPKALFRISPVAFRTRGGSGPVPSRPPPPPPLSRPRSSLPSLLSPSPVPSPLPFRTQVLPGLPSTPPSLSGPLPHIPPPLPSDSRLRRDTSDSLRPMPLPHGACRQMLVPGVQRSSLRSLTFARFARTFSLTG